MARTAIAGKPGPSAAERRAELLRRDEEFRRQRGAAVLDGKSFDSAPLVAVQQELAALDDVEAESTRRQAEAAAAARAERVAAVRRTVAAIDEKRLAAMAAAEQAAGAMVTALVEHRRLSAEIIDQLRTLGPAVPDALLPKRVDARVSEFLVGALHAVRTDQYSFGTLEWHRPSTGPLPGWAELDRAATARDIAVILNRSAK